MPTKKEEEKKNRISGNPALNPNRPYKIVAGATPIMDFKPKTSFKPTTDFTPTNNPSNIKGGMGFTGFDKNTGAFIGGVGTINRLNKKYLQNLPALQGGPELPIDAKAREMIQGLGEGVKNRYAEVAQGANKMSSGITNAINEVWPKKMPTFGVQPQGRGSSLGDIKGDFITGANKMAGDVQRGINEASVFLPRSFSEMFKPGMSAEDINRERQGLPPLQAEQKPEQAKIYTGKAGDPPATTPTAQPNIVSQPPQATFQVPPTAIQNQPSYQGKTGNRYLDMAYAGSDELQKYIQGMPEEDRPIDLIRGTERTFYDPRSQREYATMAEAAYGVSRPEMMEQYSIDAPIQAEQNLELMKMMQGQKPEYTYQKLSDMGTGQETLVKLDKRGGPPEILGTAQEMAQMITPQEEQYILNEVLPFLGSPEEDPEGFKKRVNSLPVRIQEIFERFFNSRGME